MAVSAALDRELAAQTIWQYSVPSNVCRDPAPPGGCQPHGIAGGPDGNLWFTEATANKIGRITPSGVITEFPLPAADAYPFAITRGPDDNLWFTELTGHKIGRITPAGTITEFPIAAGTSPWALAAGPDGNLWYVDYYLGRIGRLTPSGVFTEFPAGGAPFDITAGPDGNLWFTLVSNKIARITPTGTITEFPLDTPYGGAYGITSGPDGNLWFTWRGPAPYIGRITPSGVVTAFRPANAYGNPYDPWDITMGSDGNLWFTENGASLVGRVTPTGEIAEFEFRSRVGYTESWGITAGPDGDVWFAQSGGNAIGRVRLRPTSFSTVAPCRVIDTRDDAGARGGPPLNAAQERTFPIAGGCGIPTGAVAISANMTVTASTEPGDLRVYAGGGLSGSSTINYDAGQTRANNAVVPLGAGGDLSVFCDQNHGNVEFILDVNGYFE